MHGERMGELSVLRASFFSKPKTAPRKIKSIKRKTKI